MLRHRTMRKLFIFTLLVLSIEVVATFDVARAVTFQSRVPKTSARNTGVWVLMVRGADGAVKQGKPAARSNSQAVNAMSYSCVVQTRALECPLNRRSQSTLVASNNSQCQPPLPIRPAAAKALAAAIVPATTNSRAWHAVAHTDPRPEKHS